MQEERSREEARRRRLRVLAVVGGVVGVLAVAGIVGALVSGGSGDDDSSDKPVATPSGATGTDRLAIPVGAARAPATLTVYEDFRCPACGQFEKQFHTTVNKLKREGKMRVEYHIVSFIDNNVGGSGSKTAANAAACAQHEGGFPRYHDVLYANQPEETEDTFASKDRLVSLAQQVPRLKDNAGFRGCVRQGTYDGWVNKVQDGFNKSGYNSTPTVLLNGDNLLSGQQPALTPQRLEARVDRINRGS
jgi:protein-disulfide isomerase